MFVRIKITFRIYVNAHVMKELVNKGKKLWHLFIDGVQMSQCYTASMRKQFTFYHLVQTYLPLGFEQMTSGL